MRFIFLALTLLLWGCSHTIDLRSAHFLTPMTSAEQWGGSFAVSASKPTKVTLIDDIGTNPPARTGVKINQDVNAGDILLFNHIGLDLKLAVLPSLEVALDNHTAGLKWQFLNHRKENTLLASLLAAYGTRTDTTNSNGNESKTKLATTRAGISVGYGYTNWVPYLSYIYDEYKARTDVQNSSGNFGTYEDSGRHHNYALGISTRGAGFSFAVEYNHLVMKWDTADHAYQNSVGVLIGAEW